MREDERADTHNQERKQKEKDQQRKRGRRLLIMEANTRIVPPTLFDVRPIVVAVCVVDFRWSIAVLLHVHWTAL